MQGGCNNTQITYEYDPYFNRFYQKETYSQRKIQPLQMEDNINLNSSVFIPDKIKKSNSMPLQDNQRSQQEAQQQKNLIISSAYESNKSQSIGGAELVEKEFQLKKDSSLVKRNLKKLKGKTNCKKSVKMMRMNIGRQFRHLSLIQLKIRMINLHLKEGVLKIEVGINMNKQIRDKNLLLLILKTPKAAIIKENIKLQIFINKIT
eukprot:403369667